jgi:hypothetical protein
MPVTLKVGGSYLNRRGERITIECETTATGTNRFAGINTKGEVAFYGRNGRYTARIHHWDLIQEINDEKAKEDTDATDTR